MNIEDIRDYCLVKKGVTESTPFDDVTLTFKVAGKMVCHSCDVPVVTTSSC